VLCLLGVVSLAFVQLRSDRTDVYAQGADEDLPRAIVTASSLNVRRGPGTTYTRVGVVFRDDELNGISCWQHETLRRL